MGHKLSKEVVAKIIQQHKSVDVETDIVRAAIRTYCIHLANKGMTARFIKNKLIDIIESL